MTYAKPNLLFLMTAAMVILLFVYTLMWIEDMVDNESECKHDHYSLYESEEYIIAGVFIVTIFILFISLLAYSRDGRKTLIVISMGYAIIALNSLIWLFEEFHESLEGYLISNACRAVLIFSAIAIIIVVLYIGKHDRGS